MQFTAQQNQSLLHVEAYDLASFLMDVQKGVKDGYEVNLDYNETFPYGSLGHYIVKMMPKSLRDELKGVNTPVQEPTTPVEAPEIEKVAQSTSEELKAAVEASKKSPGRPAKGK